VDAPVAVVGAGLAGLSCARVLTNAGVRVQLFEANHSVGGRARTDRVDGFLLDHGFHAFFTASPEARLALDFASLGLKAFARGAQVWMGKRFHRIPDPFRAPFRSLPALFNPVGSAGDKLKLLKLWRRVRSRPVEALFEAEETTAFERLRSLGFSDVMIDAFFRPLFGGLFLERELRTSSRMLEFYFRLLFEGDVALPSGGIATVAKQLAAQLPAGTLRLGTRVRRVERDAVVLEDGQRVPVRASVIATESFDAARLHEGVLPIAAMPVTCLYFATPKVPFAGPHLLLNGEPTGPVNHIAVTTEVAPGYAPSGMSLVSATVLGVYPDDVPLLSTVRFQLASWFGDEVDAWRHLRTYVIERALPDQRPPVPRSQPSRLEPGIFVCGDHVTYGSLDGALASGRRAAAEVAEHLRTHGSGPWSYAELEAPR
jgi:phytoene dehydrogenase-like protein